MNDITTPKGNAEYRVLARKYRPQTFDDLIGQAPLVQTLKNALEQGRLAHAFVLTGVRGVGKTTTARIIAKGLNCTGADGTGGPTVNPCGVCNNCVTITEDRHVDILEMDAASRTGVDDIREIIDGMYYKPVSARYKIYIIDEVHMLSRNAFNALLKTLEEPPGHVKFVFATTEIRKVPITVLSRCQRFDLLRLSADALVDLFASICAKEGVEVESGVTALHQIARAADGSARDGLSLLDQAMAMASGPITSEVVQAMLGLADRMEIIDVFEDLMRGRLPEVLRRIQSMYERGTDPLTVAQDLLDSIHLVTRFKVAPQSGGLEHSDTERVRAEALAKSLAMPHLGRAWQMMLKGITEIQQAPVPFAALEMVLIRLAHLSDLPTPEEAVRAMQRGSNDMSASGGASPAAAATTATTDRNVPPAPAATRPAQTLRQPDQAPASDKAENPDGEAVASPTTFAEIRALFETRREAVLAARLAQFARPVSLTPGHLEIAATSGIDKAFVNKVAHLLTSWTGRHWTVLLSQESGSDTLAEQQDARQADIRREASTDPVVAAALEHFPGAEIASVRPAMTGHSHIGVTASDDPAASEAENQDSGPTEI